MHTSYALDTVLGGYATGKDITFMHLSALCLLFCDGMYVFLHCAILAMGNWHC